MEVVTIPLAMVDGSPAFTVSTESGVHATPMFFLMRVDHLFGSDGRRPGHVPGVRERRGGHEGGELASGEVSHVSGPRLASRRPPV